MCRGEEEVGAEQVRHGSEDIEDKSSIYSASQSLVYLDFQRKEKIILIFLHFHFSLLLKFME